MSLAIDIDKVFKVLIGDEWHQVFDQSFLLDSYEYIWGETAEMVHGGGNSGICATGFRFKADAAGTFISGPLSSIRAVKHESNFPNGG